MFILSPSPALGYFPWSSTKFRLFSHPVVFVLYSFINYMFYCLYFFLLSLWSCRWFPVFLCPAPVRNFTLPEFLASKQHWCLHSPLPSTCINPIGWHQTTETYHSPPSSRYELCASHHLLCNNTEECSSHLLHGGNLKSQKNKTDSIENWSVMCDIMSKTWFFLPLGRNVYWGCVFQLLGFSCIMCWSCFSVVYIAVTKFSISEAEEGCGLICWFY